MKKNELAPGDSTVVELTFNTRAYKNKVTKAATIHTNDLSNSQVRIKVSADVSSVPDSTLAFTYSPDNLQFSKDQKELDVLISNRSDRTMYLKPVGDTYADLSVKLDEERIKQSQEAKIKFKWGGEFEKEHIKRSVTFDVSASGTTRFTIPFVVQGTDPTPEKQPPAGKVKPQVTGKAPKKQ